MEEMMVCEKRMCPIPKKYRRNAVAAFNTVPEAEELAKEMSDRTSCNYHVVLDNQSGIAVVQMEDGLEVNPKDYGYIQYKDFGLKKAKDVLLFGDGEILDIFTVQLEKSDYIDDNNKPTDEKVINRCVKYLEKANQKYDFLCYAVVFRNLNYNCYTPLEILVVIKKSFLDKQNYTSGTILYRNNDNRVFCCKEIKYKNKHATFEGSKIQPFYVIVPIVEDEFENELVLDFQYGLDSKFKGDIEFPEIFYKNPVLYRPTLWSKKESRKASMKMIHERKRSASKLKRSFGRIHIYGFFSFLNELINR